MPYKSDAQRRFFNWAAQEGVGGITPKVANEWNQASKGKQLPEHAAAPRDRKKKKHAQANFAADVAFGHGPKRKK